jgi:hypothetical protein
MHVPSPTSTLTEMCPITKLQPFLTDLNARQSIVVRHNGANQKISAISQLWEPLAYPILFPHGTLGWGVVDMHAQFEDEANNIGEHVGQMEGEVSGRQIMFYRARLLQEPCFHIFGNLTNEYAVDMLMRNLETRLNYIHTNQKRLCEADAKLMGKVFVLDLQNIYLPASFMGFRHWATEQIADSLTIAAHAGNPTFFITITCNSEWPEITSRLAPGQDFSDVPTDVVHIFKQKLLHLEQCLKTMFSNAGHIQYLIHSVEFQKRGLPHAHILCKYERECIHLNDVDSVVSAEIPTDPCDKQLVHKLMTHRHPFADKPPLRYCQWVVHGHCICWFGYSQPLQETTTVDREGRVQYC